MSNEELIVSAFTAVIEKYISRLDSLRILVICSLVLNIFTLIMFFRNSKK